MKNTKKVTELPTYTCLRCGESWHPRLNKIPLCCAKCRSPYWNIPKKLKKDIDAV